MSRQILEQVCEDLLDCAVISSNKEFCESWLAKDESYMRGLRFRDLHPSADALATCASKLSYYAEKLSASSKPELQALALQLFDLRSLCQTAIEQQAKRKWMTPERMGL